MNEPRPSIDSEPHVWFERLAADELSGPARRELFAWLDRAPSRWRECALTLLEARELELALGEWTGATAAAAAADLTVARSHKPAEPRGFPRRWGRWLASVACLALAFGSGVAVEGLRARPAMRIAQEQQKKGTEAVSSASDAAEQPQPAVSNEPAPAAERDPSDAQPPLIADAGAPGNPSEPMPPYVRSKWERQGFRVEHGVVSLALPDGRNVKLPADKLRYVGRRSL